MSMPLIRPRSLSVWCGLLLAMSLPLFSGCGGKSPKRETASDDGGEDTTAGSDAGASSKSPKPDKGKKKGIKGGHIDQIPVDVWPEVWLKQPLAVAAESGASAEPGPAEVADNGKSSAEPDKPVAPKEAEPKAGASGASSWASVISGEALGDEMKNIKNRLTPNLADKGRYDSKYKEIRVDGATLAVVAAVAKDVPDAPSWKANAKYIRDAGSQIAAESKANGEQYYRKTREGFDKLDALLSGSKPPGVDESADNIKFSEVANRPYLMKRLERSYNSMKTDINSEALFKKNADKVSHEGAILSLLGKVIATPDYSDADSDEYKGYSDAMSQAGRDLNEAVKNSDFKAYTEALDRCYKACSKCHEVFRNG